MELHFPFLTFSLPTELHFSSLPRLPLLLLLLRQIFAFRASLYWCCFVHPLPVFHGLLFAHTLLRPTQEARGRERGGGGFFFAYYCVFAPTFPPLSGGGGGEDYNCAISAGKKGVTRFSSLFRYDFFNWVWLLDDTRKITFLA